MKYLGHKSDDGENREQSLLEHLAGTSALCEEFAAGFGMDYMGKLLGLYHDIGKYSRGFQKRIQEDGPKVDHSTAGAYELGKLGRDFLPLAFCIAGHHSGLMNKGAKGDLDNGTLVARMHKTLKGDLDYSKFKNELPAISIDKKQLPPFTNTYKEMLRTRMLFSCLVDADYLDTERFMQPKALVRGDFDDLGVLYERYNDYVGKWGEPVSKINKKRTEIRENCIAAAHGAEGLYSLTVPTGGGKTIASLGFALEHAMTHKNKQRIIYVIPYTSIIEQTANVFRDVVGSKNVVEHHMNVDYEDTEENLPENKKIENEQKKLATENWDAPIIVTTNVQFFESLHAKKTSRCRKLHNIANSIVIFDEAQMLPNEFLLPCVQTIEELVKAYHVTAVLCTATQPSLDKFCHQNKPKEICKDVAELYDFFRQVKYESITFADNEALINKLNEQAQALCIVNSKKTAQQIYDGLSGEGCYHLSTFMYPEHRKQVLAEVKERLKNKLPCKLIATSLVEAGVDVDFPTVFRELAGLDSIIQAAGRCNRENKRSADESIVYVFELQASDTRIPSFVRQPREVAQMIIRDFADIASVEAIKTYFDQLHDYKGEGLDLRNIISRSSDLPFSDIADDFKLIDDTGRSVFIPCNEESERVLIQLRTGVRNRSLLRKAGKYVVNVYENQFLKLQGVGIIEVLDENINILTDMAIYDEHKGLVVNVDDGIGIFC